MRTHILLLLLLLSHSAASGQYTVRDTDTLHNTSRCNPLDPFYVPVCDSSLPEKVVAFAKSLIGTPYSFGCSAPSTGFDCSGFINYVFNHFDIPVPRSSVDFTNEGKGVSIEQCMPGDLILFTGTNSKIRIVGHIGIIIANDSTGIRFIHASSGNEYKVIITKLDAYYMNRFVKVRRLGW